MRSDGEGEGGARDANTQIRAHGAVEYETHVFVLHVFEAYVRYEYTMSAFVEVRERSL